MDDKARMYIKKLELVKHPEGGYYREIYRSGEIFYWDTPPKRNKRNVSTSIYFLLSGSQISKFHKLRSDELWHFYDGCSVKIYIIDENGILTETILGRNIKANEVFQTMIKSNCWFAAENSDKRSFSLVGCTVAPGFEFSDFELAERKKLVNLYPEYKKLIVRMTKE